MRLLTRCLCLLLFLPFMACIPEAEVNGNQWTICDEGPSCPAESIPVDTCSGDCFEVTECDETILCEYLYTCDGMPMCPAGATELGPDEECPDQHTCERSSLCGITIQCAYPICSELRCPDDAHTVQDFSECPQGDVLCYPIADVCGNELWCWEATEPQCTFPGAEYLSENRCGGEAPCSVGETYFEDDCGCGCFPRDPDDSCYESVAVGIGECEMLVAYAFTGSDCVPISGCACAGPDCDRFETDSETDSEECHRVMEKCID